MNDASPIQNHSIDTTAAGQLVGYTLQYFRALLRLLQCKIGEAVSIEHLSDVSVHQDDGRLILEEDKSSLNGNPVGDLSINLWKTFYNWVNFLVDSDTDVSKCRFVLCVVSPVAPHSLLDTFIAVKDVKSANIAIRKAQKKIAESSSEKVARYANFVLKENRKVFQRILVRLEMATNKREQDIDDGITKELLGAMFPENRLDEIKNHYLGWLVTRISSDIREKKCPIIYKEEFVKENRAFANSIRSRSLVDYSLSNRPSEEELAEEAISDKVYVRQLQAIAVDQAKMIRACSDYYRASVNRQMWIEKELVSPEEADEFESKLCSAYEHEKERIELENGGLRDVQRGRLLLNACEGQQVRISDRDPVDGTIPGTYHHLSDDLRLGWHPSWENMFCKQGRQK